MHHLIVILTAPLLLVTAAFVLVQPPGAPPVAAPVPAAAPLFTDAERAAIVAYWGEQGRYTVSAPPNAPTTGPWQVRLTPDGSAWLLAYQKAIAGPGKLPPTTDATTLAKTTRPDWESWVGAKLAHDRHQARLAAALANAALVAIPSPPGPAAPPHPGPIPPDLLAACGNPPVFASVVAPLRHTIVFDDAENGAYTFDDNVPMRERYAYYRFPQGTVAYGTPLRELPPAELDALFANAGLSPSEQRIARAVSRLEGGFEAVNTYDTGFVSIGFIQFITARDGNGSLCDVLAQQKSERPADFAADFRRFGIDVSANRVYTVVDPATGAELWGAAAVMKTIEDKRLVAVFQRAGRATAFRIAQIQVAKKRYWPAEDAISVLLPGGQTLTGKASEVVKSEAGMATLFDRKVNRGSISPLADVVADVMNKYGLKNLAEASVYEREIIGQLKYRVDFLKDETLTRPR